MNDLRVVPRECVPSIVWICICRDMLFPEEKEEGNTHKWLHSTWKHFLDTKVLLRFSYLDVWRSNIFDFT